MSLLMDALKRAERAREAKEREGGTTGAQDAVEPERNEPAGETTGAGELSLEPVNLEDSATDLELTSMDLAPAAPEATGSSSTEDSGGFSLSIEDDTPPPPLADPPRGAGLDESVEMELPPLLLGGNDGEAEDTSATLPSLKAVRASVDSYFDGSDSVSIAMDAVRPDSPAFAPETNYSPDESTTITGQRLGAEVREQQAQAAAQRVLAANPPPPRSSGRSSRILVFVLLPLLVLVGGGLGVAWWVQSASAPSVVQRGGGSPSFIDSLIALVSPPSIVPAGGPVAVPRPQPVPGATGVPAAGTGTVTPSGGGTVAIAAAGAEPTDAELVARMRAEERVRREAEARARAALAAGEAVQREAGETPIDPAAPVPVEGNLSVTPPEPKVVEAPAPAPVAPAPTPAPPPQPEISDAQFEEAVRATEARLPTPPPQRGAISITKARKVDPTTRAIERAWRSLAEGDFESARRGYERVLARRPNSRDALLGAAAAAANTGRPGEAAALYRRVLAINPQDSSARAALFALAPGQDAQASESSLKSLIAAEPDAPHLHYALGNLYADAGRWPEAQSAYFEAVRHAPGNPDYAFNLAVSLDHMRQASAAADYYRKSLDLARAGDAGFDTASVTRRLAQMTSGQ